VSDSDTLSKTHQRAGFAAPDDVQKKLERPNRSRHATAPAVADFDLEKGRPNRCGPGGAPDAVFGSGAVEIAPPSSDAG
jgi:hypothetical protein